jgi:mannose-6-phosphate isomerase-like protein (cupin superfamily)
MIQYLQLKQHFDAAVMQAEVNRLTASWWKEHYNKKHYEGGWSIIPLRSVGGDPDNTFSLHTSGNETMKYKDTPLLDGCEYIKTVLDFFACEKTSVRLMKLNAGAVIKEHTDHEMSFEEGEARFHIPVQTNEQVDFYILDEKIPMKEGQCWYLNLSLKHRVSNAGTEDRVHLVIDCLVNDWVKEVFANEVVIKKEIDAASAKSPVPAEEKIKIIQQLRLMNTAMANELADNMEKETV